MSSPIACVTGGTGFLATELIAQLLKRGYRVRTTVRSLANKNVACLQALPGASLSLELHEADLLKQGTFDECMVGAEYVFHTASPFVTAGITNPQAQLYAPALDGTRNVFGSIARSIQESGVRPRVVFTSSVAAIFGRPADKPADQSFNEDDWNTSSCAEGNPPNDGIDLYRYSKLIAEKEAWALAEAQRIDMSSICPSFIVGPPRGAYSASESLRYMREALEGEVLPHRPETPLVDVRDCAQCHIAAAETPAAAKLRFITSSERPVARSAVLRALQAKHGQTLQLMDDGEPPEPASSRKIFRSKTMPLLGVTLRDPIESLLDMAEAMLRLGAVKPKMNSATK